ncbi:hypothetical protein BDA96_05G133900 [Sorghum bicolor]|uniref:Uncharacterized protein n=1 Tax=Sorghum bicolor TaxID=4558 RepID=A0A921QX50_SORBI|nr:hypothetical protein BDA96_05G133900 [Sorghum bicolor]
MFGVSVLLGIETRAFGGSNICFLKKNVVAVLMASYEKELNLFFDVCLGYLDGDDL